MPDLLRGRYEPIEVLGHGGEARVVKAVDRQHDRIVALKIRTVRDDADREVLLAEAGLLLDIPPHPHLPLVREDFFEDDVYVIAMDWIEGTDLAALLRSRGRPGLAPASVFEWLADAAGALTHLHTLDRPVVHGDVKPANLILTSGGRVVLVDFGLSSAPDSVRRRGGTVGFAAPELAAGAEPSRATDVYSLAATAFALLVGEAPTGIRPAWENIDPYQALALEEAIRAGLATDPAKRIQTPGELVERLRSGLGSTLPTGVLTFCLTDIEGSTALWDTRPAQMARALVQHDELVAEVVEAQGGRFLKSMGEGDATVSVFPAATAALSAMVELQHRLAEPLDDDLMLKVRAAVHTGEAERRGGDYFGPTLNLAARLRGLGDGGEIFLSSTTAALVRNHLADDVTLVDLGVHRLKGLAHPESVFALDAPGVPAPLPGTTCPYPGLPAFEADDADRFFGREDVVAEIVERLGRDGFVAVVGASGSGKSSVLRAGVGPAWGDPVVVTPGCDAEPLAAPAGTLVIVDQFEEVFTLCADDRRRTAFLDSIVAWDGPLALGMRADVYGRCAEHPALAAAVAGSQLLLGPMQEDELRRAIVGPAEAAGLKVEPALVDVLVGEVAGEPGGLPLLSHALRATWEHRDGRTLTLAAYRETGGLRRAIATTAEQVYASLDAAAQSLARRTFLALTEPGEGTDDSRRRATIDELTPAAGGEGLDALLQGMADARLVTVSDNTVEVAHEALIREWPRLRAWLDEDRDGLRLHRQLAGAAATWDELGRQASELYRGPRLAAAVEWAGRTDDVSTLEAAFLDASTDEATREERSRVRTNRRLRSLLAGVGVLLVLAVIAAAVAFVQQRDAADSRDQADVARDRADTERDQADIARIAAVSRGVVERQPDLGLLLAVAAHDLDDNADTRGALLGALEAHPLLEGLVYGEDSALEEGLLTDDGKLLVTPTSDGTGTLVWDVETRRVVDTLVAEEEALNLDVAISPDGRLLAVPSIVARDNNTRPDGQLQVWDLESRELHTVVDSPAGTLTTADFSADGTRLYTQGGPKDVDNEPPGVVVVWDTETWEPVDEPWVLTEGYPGDEAVFMSADGSLLAAPLPPDGTSVGVWSVDDQEEVAEISLESLGAPPAFLTGIAFSPDGGTLALTTELGTIYFVDPVSGEEVRPPIALAESVSQALAFSPDGTVLAVGRIDGRTQLYSVAAGDPLGPPLAASSGGITDVSFSSDGSRLATMGVDRTGAIWRLDGSRAMGVPLAGQDGPVTEAQYTADGSQIVTASLDGTVAVRSADGAVVDTVEVAGEVLSVDVSGSGRVAAAGNGGQLSFFGLDGSDRVDVDLGSSWAHQVAFAPSGDVVAVTLDHTGDSGGAGPGTGEVRFVDPATGEEGGDAIELDDGPVGVVFAPDGKTLAVVQMNNIVRFFDASTHEDVLPIVENVDAPITSLAYSPDGTTIAVGVESGVVRTFDAVTHEPVGEDLVGDQVGVFGVAYSPDGSLIAGTALGLSTTRLWDAESGAPLGEQLTGGEVPYTFRTFEVQHFMGARPAFSPDGTYLVTPGFEGATVLWDLSPSSWRDAACGVVGRDLTEEEWERYLPDQERYEVCAS